MEARGGIQDRSCRSRIEPPRLEESEILKAAGVHDFAVDPLVWREKGSCWVAAAIITLLPCPLPLRWGTCAGGSF